MALVRFTQEAPQQTGNQQHAGLRTQQSIALYSRVFQTTKGIQQADLSEDLTFDPAKQSRAVRA